MSDLTSHSGVLVDEPPGPTDAAVGGSGRRLAWPAWGWDAVVVGLYVLAAAIVFGRLWADPNGVVLRDNGSDQALFEWMFRHDADALTHGQNPFLAPELGTPTTANLAANTSVVLPGVLLAPITLLFGASVTFITFATIALAGTAAGWYVLLRRRLGMDQLPAAFAGLFCGFAPGMLAQVDGHPHIAAQFLVPLIVALVLRLGEEGRPRPAIDGLYLGLAVAAQVLIGAEVLAMVALAMPVFAIAYFFQRPKELADRIRRGWLAVPVATGTVLLLVGYPLYLMLFSPLAYDGIPNATSGGDVAAFWRFSTLSIGGESSRMRWSMNVSEQSAYFGLPLILAMAGAMVWHWRTVWLRSAAITALFWCVCSFGVRIRVHGKDRGTYGPWRWLYDKPLLHDIIVTRLALIAIPIIGILLAATWQRSRQQFGPRAGLILPVLLMLAVAPTLPAPLHASERPSVPAFISDGDWRSCVSPGGTLVGYGTQSAQRRVGLLQMRWQEAADMAYNSPNGYYIAVGADGTGQWGQPLRLTDRMILDAIRSGTPTAPGANVAEVNADLAYWGADCVVIEQSVQHADAVVATATAMFGEAPKSAGGAWYWDVRDRG